jgi:dipeptidase D
MKIKKIKAVLFTAITAVFVGAFSLVGCEIKDETEMRIISVSGGLKDNAIPRESFAEIMVLDKAKAEQVCREMEKCFKNEYSLTDAEVFVKIDMVQGEMPLDKTGTDKTVAMLCCLPNGIMEMSAGIKGLVQTSLNMGILKTDENAVIAEFGVRSSIDSQKEMLLRRVKCLMESLGGTCEASGRYSGWEYKNESPLRDLMSKVYEDMYGKKPVIQAIHAGLECGTFAGKIEDFDGISIGPDMKDIHTFSETLYVKSTERVYEMIIETLKRMKF